MRSHYKNGFLKQYVRDNRLLRTEAATNHVTDYGLGKAVENLPQLGPKLEAITAAGNAKPEAYVPVIAGLLLASPEFQRR